MKNLNSSFPSIHPKSLSGLRLPMNPFEEAVRMTGFLYKYSEEHSGGKTVKNLIDSSRESLRRLHQNDKISYTVGQQPVDFI
jgi:hypothetical protein